MKLEKGVYIYIFNKKSFECYIYLFHLYCVRKQLSGQISSIASTLWKLNKAIFFIQAKSENEGQEKVLCLTSGTYVWNLCTSQKLTLYILWTKDVEVSSNLINFGTTKQRHK